ncbi:MAG: hypothetical protein KatS3mg076_1726 [Candidatus Binatia bacterium]|nr:MAG: hypothetical protein KatS3mg076_1726 [Candidatus Binatia bacterium]
MRLLSSGTRWVVLLALAVLACGRKGPVRPLELLLPEPVSELRASVEGGAVVLRWRAPNRRLDGSRLEDLSSFLVERAENEGPFRVVGVVVLDEEDRALEVRRFAFRDETVESGARYRYRVVSRTLEGYVSPASVPVEIRVDGVSGREPGKGPP